MNICIHLEKRTVTWHFIAATKAIAKYPEEILASVSRDISPSSMYEFKTPLPRVLVSSIRSNSAPYCSHLSPRHARLSTYRGYQSKEHYIPTPLSCPEVQFLLQHKYESLGLLLKKARLRAQCSTYGIHDGEKCHWRSFLPNTLVSPVSIVPPTVHIHSFI